MDVTSSKFPEILSRGEIDTRRGNNKSQRKVNPYARKKWGCIRERRVLYRRRISLEGARQPKCSRNGRDQCLQLIKEEKRWEQEKQTSHSIGFIIFIPCRGRITTSHKETQGHTCPRPNLQRQYPGRAVLHMIYSTNPNWRRKFCQQFRKLFPIYFRHKYYKLLFLIKKNCFSFTFRVLIFTWVPPHRSFQKHS